MKIFGNRLIPGRAIGAQKTFAADFNAVMEILENMEGAGQVEIDKSNAKYWRIKIKEASDTGGGSGGIPAGYTAQNRITQIQYDSTYYKLQIKKGTVLVKDDSEDADWTTLLTFQAFDA